MSKSPELSWRPVAFGPLVVFALNLLATVQVVWFYLARVECHIRLLPYEQGRERIPFQYRLLLMGPMRWAHQSHAVQAAAAWLTVQRGFFPNGVRAEGLAQAGIDLACVCVAGLVARKLYVLSSPTGLLTSYIYPLTLLMVLNTYVLLTMHSYRFIYDLPSLAFFSLGLYCIYLRKRAGWLAAVFVVGTLNRETTLLLLVFYVLAQCHRGQRFDWRQSYARATLMTALPLIAFWLGWHLWVAHMFQGNPSAAQPRVSLNLSILAVPFTWPQVVGTFAYVLPVVILYRRHITDALLKTWLWALPVWFVFMLYYGVFVETRVFGELIPYIACVSALIAEDKILEFLERRGAYDSGHAWSQRSTGTDAVVRERSCS
jgi:hypothetical protein